jgi:hypothetical protein
MDIRLRSTGPDPVADEGAKVAREFVLAMVMDYDEDFFSIPWTGARAFIEGSDDLDDAAASGTLPEVLKARAKREATLTACLAMIAAVAIDGAVPDDEEDRTEWVTAFFDRLAEKGITF